MIGPTRLCPQGIGLILLDLDDTVMMDGAVVSSRVTDAVNLARQHGCMASVSTGRDYHMVPELLRQPANTDYLICANGARILDSIGGVLLERLMTREQVLAAMDALTPLGPGWNTFIDGCAYFEWRSLSYFITGRRVPLESGEMRRALHTGSLYKTARKAFRFGKRVLGQREGMRQVLRVRPRVQAAERGVAKLGCSLPSRVACDRAVATLEHLGGFEVARMSATELEITAEGVTKATAARWLMDYLHVGPEVTVAFGDSENDAPLAEACGAFVAMANGDGRIREIADDVCESVYDDGVARWLERAMAEANGANHV